jgi:hypothetical protein
MLLLVLKLVCGVWVNVCVQQLVFEKNYITTPYTRLEASDCHVTMVPRLISGRKRCTMDRDKENYPLNRISISDTLPGSDKKENNIEWYYHTEKLPAKFRFGNGTRNFRLN